MTSIKGRSRGMWLVGQSSEATLGCKLPSNRQVLSRLHYLHCLQSKGISESATIIADEVLLLWEKARITTRQHYHVVSKIKEIFAVWKNIKKNAKRQTAAQQFKEGEFVNKLDLLFDIAHANAMNLITVQEDRDFLVAQRETGRRGSMGPIDVKLTQLEK